MTSYTQQKLGSQFFPYIQDQLSSEPSNILDPSFFPYIQDQLSQNCRLLTTNARWTFDRRYQITNGQLPGKHHMYIISNTILQAIHFSENGISMSNF